MSFKVDSNVHKYPHAEYFHFKFVEQCDMCLWIIYVLEVLVVLNDSYCTILGYFCVNQDVRLKLPLYSL